MNLEKYKREAFLKMPALTPEIAAGMRRHEIVKFLYGTGNIGIELGVADGYLSKRLLDSEKFKLLYGVDIYGDIHDTNEYKEALKFIGFDVLPSLGPAGAGKFGFGWGSKTGGELCWRDVSKR